MSWKIEQTISIGPDRAEYVDKAKYFHRTETDASVSAAVDKLNKEELVAEDGYCIVYSDTNSEFFLLWQEGKKDQAFKAAGLNEKENTTKERVATAIEQNPVGTQLAMDPQALALEQYKGFLQIMNSKQPGTVEDVEPVSPDRVQQLLEILRSRLAVDAIPASVEAWLFAMLSASKQLKGINCRGKLEFEFTPK